MKDKSVLLYGAWGIALVGMLGSLYFSEILKLPPCSLCWYQRIFLYPLSIILLIGILRRDPNINWYALPLAIGGFVIAVYHTLLQAGIIAESILPCVSGIPCQTPQIELLGFITIPMLSLLAFGTVICLLILSKGRKQVQ